MPTPASQPTYRQERALEAIERAATELEITIRTHAPPGDPSRQARDSIRMAVETLKRAILRGES